MSTVNNPTRPRKVYEDNETVAESVTSHRVAPRLRRVDIRLFCMHNEHGKGTFELAQTPTRVQLANRETTPESGHALLRNESFTMENMHVVDLPDDQHQALITNSPISCYKYYQRNRY